MPEKHRTDMAFGLQQMLANANQTALLAGCILWPYINIEDFSKPQPLLVYLNARARNLPWTFIEQTLPRLTSSLIIRECSLSGQLRFPVT